MPNATKTDIRPGDTVRVYQKIKEGDPSTGSGQAKERLQAFEGLVLARKHGSEPGATITVRKEVAGVGVERIFPIHSPLIDRMEVIRKGKARRAKLYYMREATGQRARIKERV